MASCSARLLPRPTPPRSPLSILLLLASLLYGCAPTLEQSRALSVAGCLSELAASIPPDAKLPQDPRELTVEDLELAARLVEGVRECRAKGGADAGAK